MAAYVIADIEVRDPEAYEEYRRAVRPTIEAFGGRFLARGGGVVRLEGDWTPKRIVILEFESLERAREWWSSDLYAAPKRLRQSLTTGSLIVVEGV
jgi:uncharacterized protein (DUF1330 family)